MRFLTLKPAPLQARLLYHEAACSDEVAGELGPGQRPVLLREALSAAAAATDAAPASLSCAALRATLVVNLLVENGRGQVGLWRGAVSRV